jgi:hypothetical protein
MAVACAHAQVPVAKRTHREPAREPYFAAITAQGSIELRELGATRKLAGCPNYEVPQNARSQRAGLPSQSHRRERTAIQSGLGQQCFGELIQRELAVARIISQLGQVTNQGSVLPEQGRQDV